jgi:hypothetical protein
VREGRKERRKEKEAESEGALPPSDGISPPPLRLGVKSYVEWDWENRTRLSPSHAAADPTQHFDIT